MLYVQWFGAVSDIVFQSRVSYTHSLLTPLQPCLVDGPHRLHRVTCQIPAMHRKSQFDQWDVLKLKTTENKAHRICDTNNF